MANHKRKRPKNRRAGCLMCKGWKANGVKGSNKANWRGNRRPDQSLKQELRAWQEAASASFHTTEAMA